MIYGYIRVSTDKQTVENQRGEIIRFCEAKGLAIDAWIEETVSGKKDYKKRNLGNLLNKINAGDLIIASEISRLGRSLFMVMEILNTLMNKGAQVWTIKDNFRLGDDIQSKVIAFAYSLSAEIERNLISQRTIEGLKRVRAEGRILGRPQGSKSSVHKLTPVRDKVMTMRARGVSYSAIARKLKVHRLTVSNFVKMNYQPTKEI